MNGTPPAANKRNYVRAISLFLVVILFVPQIKDALNIKLIKIEDGYIGLWQIFVVVSVAMLLPALMFDNSDKIDIPFIKKFLKDD